MQCSRRTMTKFAALNCNKTAIKDPGLRREAQIHLFLSVQAQSTEICVMMLITSTSIERYCSFKKKKLRSIWIYSFIQSSPIIIILYNKLRVHLLPGRGLMVFNFIGYSCASASQHPRVSISNQAAFFCCCCHLVVEHFLIERVLVVNEMSLPYFIY